MKLFKRLPPMKFTQLMSLLLVFLFLLTDARGYSQSLLDKKISLQTSQEDIKKVLSRIEEQADVHFAYSPQNVGNDKLYLNYQDQSLSVILNQIFKKQNISYQVQGSSIILYKNEERQNIVVKGRVADASNNPLNGVSVSVKSSTAGTSTNLQGSFSLSVPDENAILVFSYV
ncbi:MAG: carboxypeptidase-like regulatory domain-containing protein, partial [Segetibacter sp.]